MKRGEHGIAAECGERGDVQHGVHLRAATLVVFRSAAQLTTTARSLVERDGFLTKVTSSWSLRNS